MIEFFENIGILTSLQKYTDKHRDNIPALLFWNF